MKSALVFFFAVTVSVAAEPRFGDPTRGQRLFVDKGCVQCHAVRGAGGGIGPDLGRSSVKNSFYEIFSSMWNHSAAMHEKMKESRLMRPAFVEDELSDLLAFRIAIDAAWLAQNTLVAVALESEVAQWASVGIALEIEATS